MTRTTRCLGVVVLLALIAGAICTVVFWVTGPQNSDSAHMPREVPATTNADPTMPPSRSPVEWTVGAPEVADSTPQVEPRALVVPPAIARLLEGAETLEEEKARIIEGKPEPDRQVYERRRLIKSNKTKASAVVVRERFVREGAETRLLKQELQVADQVLVRLQKGTPLAALEQINERFGARIVKKSLAPDTYLVQLKDRSIAAVAKAVATYRAEAATISIAEPNYILYAIETVPNDTYFASNLYAMRNTGQTGGTAGADIKATMAWDITTGSANVLVGIIDTGIDYNHPDLAANIWTNPGEIPGNGIDDDNNGFIDDVHGWDFAYDDNDPLDGHYHGTHCAGTIGGAGNNGQGVVGVCWTVRMAGIKFLNDYGSGSLSDAVDAIYYATRIGCHLTSNSWGGGGYSQALKDAIDDAGAHGALFIAAAGNSGTNNDTTPFYPSGYSSENIIAVAATDHNDAKASFSCYGLQSVHLGAPGVNIFSCKPGNQYQLLSGTSMATPHVSGVCALVKSLAPSLSVADWKSQILGSVDPIPALSGKCITGGRLNALKAVQALAGPYVAYKSSTVDDNSTGGSIGNGDGVINPGETIGLSVLVRSVGNQSALGVVGILSLASPDPAVSVIGNTVAYGDLPSGQESTGSGQFLIRIQPDCPTPKTLAFVLTLTDAQANVWTNPFSYQVLLSTQIAGVVLKDGQPIMGATVTYAGPRTGTATTDANGQYSFLATDGTYMVKAGFGDYLDSNAVALTVPPGQAGVDFAFTTVTVDGQVRSMETGLGMAGVSVNYTGSLTGGVTTDANGQYAITRVFGRSGEMTVVASLAGYLPSDPVTLVLPPSATHDFLLGRPDIAVSPGSFTFTVEQGETANGTLAIANNGSLPLLFTVSPSSDAAPTGLWHQTSHRVHGEATSWYYGIENQWSYDTGARTGGVLTFAEVKVPTLNPVLSFWQWRRTEHNNYYDASWVQVSNNGGADWTTVFACSADDAEWVQTLVSLSAFKGQTVQLRFFFETYDNVLNNFEGWYLSEIRIDDHPVGWLTATPNGGSVPVLDSTDVHIQASAVGLEPGSYSTVLRVRSNDPDTPQVDVPVLFTVNPATALELTSTTLNDDATAPSAGDGNGVAESGETIELFFNLSNRGVVGATGVTGTLTTASPYLTIQTASSPFPNLPSGSTAVNAVPFVLAIDLMAPDGYLANLTLTVVTDTKTFTFQISLPITQRLRLTGRVMDGIDGNPVQGALVCVFPDFSGLTGADGTYAIEGIPPGTYALTVTKTGYDTPWRSVTFPPNGQEDFSLDRASMVVTPVELTQTLKVWDTGTQSLLLANQGTLAMDWTALVTTEAGAYAYQDSDHLAGPVYNWIEISDTGTQIVGLLDDSNTGPLPIGFSFPFYGQKFTTFNVCSNGWLSMTSTSSDYFHGPLPDPTAPENLIAFLWADLNFEDGGTAYYKLIDPTTLVVEFKEVSYYYYPGKVTCQVILRADGSILFQYQLVDRPDDCTVGIQNATCTSGLQIACDQPYLKNQFAVRLAPLVTWLTVVPANGQVAPSGSGSATVSYDPSSLTAGTHTALIEVSSNDPIHPTQLIPVTLQVLANAAPVIVLDATANPNPVLAGTTVLSVAAIDPDGGPQPLSYQWSVAGNPASAILTGDTSPECDATFSGPGNYRFQVVVSDGWDSAVSEVTVKVPAADVYVDAAYPVAEDTDFDNQFKTIGAALAVVATGGRVHVADGTYAEDVLVRDALTLFGDVATGSVRRLAFAGTAADAIVQPGLQNTIGRLHVLNGADFSGGVNSTLKVRVGSLPANPQPGVHYDGIFSSTGQLTLGGNSRLRLDMSNITNQCGTIYPVDFGSLAAGTRFDAVEFVNNAGLYNAQVSYQEANGDVRVDLMCPPATLQVTGTATSRPQFSWNVVAGADGYDLQIRRKSSGALVLDQPGASSPFTSNVDLYAGVEYVCYVRTHRGVLVSSWRQVDFTINALAPPSNLVVSGCDVTLRPCFTWTNNSGSAHDIQIQRKLSGAVAVSKSGAPNPYTCEVNLAENVAYEWFVRAHQGGLIGPWVQGPDFVVNVVPESIANLSASVGTVGTLTKLGVVGASASGEFSASFVAGNGVDGLVSADWNGAFRSGVQEEWYRVDLGVAKTVGKVRILPRGSFPLLMPGTFVLEGSVDGVSYTTLRAESGYVAGSGVWYEVTFNAVSARYVRFRANTVNAYGVNSVGFAELEVWGIDPKLGVVGASASGEFSASFAAGNGVDGLVSTDWNGPFRSGVQEEWYRVDLGVAKTVGKVRILPRGSFPLLMPGTFVLEGSVDGVSYTTLRVESGYVAASGVWYEVTFNAVSARYVRFRANTVNAYGVNSVGFAELEVWAPQGQGVQLSWTAPGDNGAVGTATSYEVRYSTSGAITDETKWGAAAVVSSTYVPTPAVAGTAQSMTVPVSALPSEATLYFSLRAVDAVGNRGGLSNSPNVATPGIAPAAVTDLSVSNPTAAGFTVSFTAVGDDGNVGTSTSYDVRCSTSQLTESNWASATVMTGEPAPKAAGSAESFAVSGATGDTTYYVGIKVVDEVGNWSGLSNVVTIKTLDAVAPSAVVDLSASVGTVGTLTKLGVVGASASGEFSASFAAGNGVDGLVSTDWNGPFRSGVQEEWYRVDLGVAKTVGKVRILPRGSFPLLMPGTFVLEGSVDGVSYTTLRAESGYVAASGVWYEVTFNAASARYVRFRANTVNAYGVNSVGFAELEVWGIDPKLGVVGASASGEFSASFAAGNGVDGLVSTDWNGPFRSGVQEEWYRVDLGVAKTVGKVRILPRGSFPLLMPGTFVLEGSVDGVSYTTLRVESGYVAASGVWYEVTFNAASARYVRFRANTVNAYGVNSVGFAELEVWAPQGQGVQLNWTAPGDNGAVGTATSYEVRYSTSGAITSGNWASATAVSSTYVPTPLVAGTAQSMTVPLTALGSPATGTVIYFCVRAKDDANLQGGVSNAVSVTAP